LSIAIDNRSFNAKLAVEYAYDANGNMTRDDNSKISIIKYNLLNLPDTIQFVEGSQNRYTYNAAGQKLTLINYTPKAMVNIGEEVAAPVASKPGIVAAVDLTKTTTD